MTQELNLAREKIEREKAKVRHKEKILKEKEKQRRAKRFVEIGRIASNANIDTLESEVLLGAFLEIAERLQDNNYKFSCMKKAEEFQNSRAEADHTPLSICFKSVPSKEIKEKLKSAGFNWNSFRKEFCGYGEIASLENLLSGQDFKIEVVG